MISNNLGIKIQNLLVLLNRINLPIYVYKFNQGELILLHRNNISSDVNRVDLIDDSLRNLICRELHVNNQQIIKDLHKCAEQKTNFSKNYDFSINHQTVYQQATIDFCYLHPEIIVLIIQNHHSSYNSSTIEQKANKNLKKALKHYEDSYNRLKIFKDLFTHDINNILNNIKMAVQLGNYYLNKEKSLDKVKKMCLSIADQITRGEKLIKNMIVQSQLQDYKIKLHKINLYDYLINAINYIHKSFVNRNIDIEISPNSGKVFIKANEFIQDVFENLLLNAVKFNDKNRVEIKILIKEIKKNKGNFIEIQFIDNGIGIPDGLKEKIFRVSHKSNQDQRGLGIGLSLIKKIMKLYKGTIRVENRKKDDYQEGSRFILTIPSYQL